MKLRKPKESPPGGFYFVCSDGYRVESATDLRRLERGVRDYYSANGITAPSDLSQMIEDQICERLPAGYCWKGFGDIVANAIQGAAGVVDSALGTQLQAAAKSCSSCGQRKRKLNRMTNS